MFREYRYFLVQDVVEKARRLGSLNPWDEAYNEANHDLAQATNRLEDVLASLNPDCNECNGTGVVERAQYLQVTHEMALDAQMPDLEGQSIYDGSYAEVCDVCGGSGKVPLT